MPKELIDTINNSRYTTIINSWLIPYWSQDDLFLRKYEIAALTAQYKSEKAIQTRIHAIAYNRTGKHILN